MNRELLELIISNAVTFLILSVSIFLYVYTVGAVIWRFVPSLTFFGCDTYDRGIRKLRFDGGRAIRYFPELRYRRYVDSYVLMEKDGRKYIKCKIDPHIRSISYDIIVYDSKGKLLDVIGVCEHIRSVGYTEMASLPPDTSYISFVLRRVDGMFSSSDIRVTYDKKRLLISMILTLVVTAFEGYLIGSCAETFLLLFSIKAISGKTMLAVSVLAGAIIALLMGCVYIRKIKRVVNRDE